MSMKAGQKIVAPFVRATSSSGVVHAVENTGEVEHYTVCGKKTKGADQPVKRFQSGIEHYCTTCYGKVAKARAEMLRTKRMIARGEIVGSGSAA